MVKSRAWNLVLVIAGGVIQAVSMFDVPAVKPYAAGLLAMSGMLLMIGNAKTAFRASGQPPQ